MVCFLFSVISIKREDVGMESESVDVSPERDFV